MMPNAKDIFSQVVARITIDEPLREVNSIAYRLLNAVAQITKTDIAAEKHTTAVDWVTLNARIARINRHEPIQYVLEEQAFYGRSFRVTPAVLIPRPETELIVDIAIARAKERDGNRMRVFDIGTGSGCIPITLALEVDNMQVYGLDKSRLALEIAQHNALQYRVDMELFHHDLLIDPLPSLSVDMVVSNPPYVCYSEQKDIHTRVIDYEPHDALFVPDSNPLCFYESIARKSKSILQPGGIVIVEINERFGRQVAALFDAEHYCSTAVVQDAFGKDRVVHAVYSG